MGQRLYIRVSCDSHPDLFGEERAIEVSVDDATRRPPMLHTLTWDGDEVDLFICDECIPRVFGLAFTFAEAKGQRKPRRGRPMKGTSEVPAITRAMRTYDTPEPAVPEPAVPEPVTIPQATFVPLPLALENSTNGNGNGHKPPDESPQKDDVPAHPCPLCEVSYLSSKGLRIHTQDKHGRSLEELIGTRCHACGREMKVYKLLASHFAVSHVRLHQDVGRTLSESVVWARRAGDPHGTLAHLEVMP